MQLTDEELGRIATEHTGDDGFCAVCWGVQVVNGRVEYYPVAFPCDAARLYALVIRQSALLVAWGLPCSCDPDFDLELAP